MNSKQLNALVSELDDTSYLNDDIYARSRDAIVELRGELAVEIDNKETWMRCQIKDSKNHAAREALWRELDQLCRSNGPISREMELRKLLGVK